MKTATSHRDAEGKEGAQRNNVLSFPSLSFPLCLCVRPVLGCPP
jgi:hypothetical protein